MSQTIAQRHRTSVHVPLTPILAVLATAIVAAAALVLINQPTTTSTSIETEAGVATAAQAAAVPMPESPTRSPRPRPCRVPFGRRSEPLGASGSRPGSAGC